MSRRRLPQPSGFHPDLTSERLAELGSLIVERHNSAVRDERRMDGDGNWSTGCRAYERVRNGIREKEKTTPWLTYGSEGSQAFFFLVGKCPMKIAKPGQHKHVTPREQEAREALQLPLTAPDGGDAYSDLAPVLRIEKTVGVDRKVAAVHLKLASADGENVYETWLIYQPEAKPVASRKKRAAHDAGRAQIGVKKRSRDAGDAT